MRSRYVAMALAAQFRVRRVRLYALFERAAAWLTSSSAGQDPVDVRKHDREGDARSSGRLRRCRRVGHECARREVQEETGIVLGHLRFLSSFPNTYLYRDVLYNTLDIILVSTPDEVSTARAGDDLADLVWIHGDAVDYDRIAFPSLRKAVRLFLASRP